MEVDTVVAILQHQIAEYFVSILSSLFFLSTSLRDVGTFLARSLSLEHDLTLITFKFDSSFNSYSETECTTRLPSRKK